MTILTLFDCYHRTFPSLQWPGEEGHEEPSQKKAHMSPGTEVRRSGLPTAWPQDGGPNAAAGAWAGCGLPRLLGMRGPIGGERTPPPRD
ncbi:hypothetical protein NDU88_002662 [Pleurodeles waltl]|uniref:Uncharacterized protein n=1 Tax=Pleurodeles waltl TaxID=8319 RepID=A0AAV7T3J8_PLEWA|nr:hypothetical protein NDU88_002662 [Pleurodeles waltl]